MTRLYFKLAFGAWRARKLQVALVLVVVAVTSATISVALHISAVANAPWDLTFDQTKGAHAAIVGRLTAADAEALAAVPGVSEVRGPLVSAFTSFRQREIDQGVRLLGMGDDATGIEQPVVVQGRWFAPGAAEVVLERSFAKAIGARPGDTLAIPTPDGALTATVVGIAVSTLEEPYPQTWPGLAFVPPEFVAGVRSEFTSTGVFVRLANPEATGAFLTSDAVRRLSRPVGTDSWQDRRADALELTRVTRVILSAFGVIILIVAALVVSTLVAGRVVAQRREFALWRAIGLSARQVGALVLVDALALALLGGLAGGVAGIFVTPILAQSPAELVGAVEPRLRLEWLVAAALAPALATGVVSFAALWRSLGAPLSGALQSASAGTGRAVRLPAFALPRSPAGLAMALAVGGEFARRGRSAVAVGALVITVGCVVAGLSMEASFAAEDRRAEGTGAGSRLPGITAAIPSPDEDYERTQGRVVVHGLTALLTVLTLANLYAVATLGYRERQREFGLLRALGFGPREIWAGVLAAAAAAASVAFVAGVPLGIALVQVVYQMADDGGDAAAMPAWWWFGAVALGGFVVTALASAASAYRPVRMPATEALRHE